MKTNKTISIILCALCISVYAQGQGFFGKKNEIGINLFDILSFRNTIEYKRTITNHFGAFGSFSYINGFSELTEFEDEDEEPDGFISTGDVYGEQRGNGYELGTGLFFNTNSTGVPLPIGHYFGFGYYYKSADFNETINERPEIGKFRETGHSVRLLLGRDFFLNKTLSLDTFASIGYTFGTIAEESELGESPQELFVTSNGLFDTQFDKNGNSWIYSELYVRIGLKFNVLF